MVERSLSRVSLLSHLALGACLAFACGCKPAPTPSVVESNDHGPTTPSPTPSSSSVATVRPAPASSASVAAPVDSAVAPPSTSASAAVAVEAPTPSVAPAASAASPVAPPLVDAAGVLLPQTEDKPALDSPIFQYRLSNLVKAIEMGNAELARDFFFPKAAYEKVKAIKQPGVDWEKRLWKLFQRDVADYHAKLGDAAAGTKLVRLEVNESRIKWMKPQSEGNTLGYFRVTRNKLHVRDGAGKEHIFEITSFISWRGQWYVVHLNGFK